MAAFLKSPRNLVIIAVFLLAMAILGVFLAVVFPQKGRGAAVTIASPSPEVSPSPSPSPSPSVRPTASPSPSSSTAILKSGSAPDDASSAACPGTCFGGNGGAPDGCHTTGLNWHHTGWTQDNCDIINIGDSADTSMAWVTEHKDSATGATATRVSIMTPAPSTGQWRTVLWAMDEVGGSRWSMLTAETGDITGDDVGEVVVGYRLVGTSHALALDAVRRSGTAAPTVLYHRDVTMGRATVDGGHLVEYQRESATTGTRYIDNCTASGCTRGASTGIEWTAGDAPPPSDFGYE